MSDSVLHVPRDQLIETVSRLRSEGYVSAMDVTAVDYLEHPVRGDLSDEITAERFELVVTLISYEARTRIRLRVQVPADDPVVPTLFDLYPGTEALEREVADMFGIIFEGHPDPTRILMPPDWQGHPLRKDFSVGCIPVQFKATR
ncbi:MAG: NADH-quinone oxidoreductase subunit C [Acidimicrobiia bacterium]|nr:NADH-quinone oxidoreductase subunit C [Acidimicrobiia bacterium]MYC57698.1 NADH-quinone oxidoreductase subunit C [Acidimicrobiia bacterium]MYG93602.1 NADH-quinone oxidoreductase subunit C [Acidimicrobiia bacterium]MYI30897.1 NADH-quinone oxidoreductase subunit C [Acidimicrobiia bacterium]